MTNAIKYQLSIYSFSLNLHSSFMGHDKHWSLSQQSLGERKEYTIYSN